MTKTIATLLLTGLTAITLAGCNFPMATPAGTSSAPNSISTAAALTVEAMGTELAGGTVPAPISAITATPAAGANPGVNQTGSPNPQPSALASSNTPAAADASTATPAPTAIPCDRAKFDSETIPDGTTVTAGSNFTKTWTLKNNGSCTWNSSYSVVFVSGDALGGPASIPLTAGNVQPGQTVQISMDLKAPAAEGKYRGNWELRNASGAIFGLGTKADQNFWVDIKVTTQPTTMIDGYCLATWTSDAGTLPCPGKEGDQNGYVIKLDAPHMENDSTDNDPALWTNPQAGDGGEISGHFPPITISTGKHFKTIVGCLYGAKTCDVKFTLKYIADGGSVKSLGEWNEKYDGQLTNIDIDLTSLAGKSVQFILNVHANGPATDNHAFWLKPRIE